MFNFLFLNILRKKFYSCNYQKNFKILKINSIAHESVTHTWKKVSHMKVSHINESVTHERKCHTWKKVSHMKVSHYESDIHESAARAAHESAARAAYESAARAICHTCCTCCTCGTCSTCGTCGTCRLTLKCYVWKLVCKKCSIFSFLIFWGKNFTRVIIRKILKF